MVISIKHTSEGLNLNTCWHVSFKRSAIKQPTKRPKGIINSWFLEMENKKSDNELVIKYTIRDHFNAFCPRKSSRPTRISTAFFRSRSLTELGMASHNFSFTVPICNLTLLGSPNSDIETFIQHVDKASLWMHGRWYLWNCHGFCLKTLICSPKQTNKKLTYVQVQIQHLFIIICFK